MPKVPDACRRGLPLAALCIWVISCLSCAHSPQRLLTPDETDAWRAIDAAHAQEEEAVSRKDADGVMVTCSPDYIATLTEGRVANKEQSRETMVALFQMSDSMKETNTIQSLRLDGNMATIIVKNHVEITMKNPFTGQTETKEQNDLDRELWIKSTQGWLIKSSEVLKSS
jgi:ketosteroid isomerase-like protein